MTVQYIHLDYESYKHMQEQMQEFCETTHKTTSGFYHKSIRLKIGPDLIMEFHGPLVGGYGHKEEALLTAKQTKYVHSPRCSSCGAGNNQTHAPDCMWKDQ